MQIFTTFHFNKQMNENFYSTQVLSSIDKKKLEYH